MRMRLTRHAADEAVKPFGLRAWARRRPEGWGLTRGKQRPWVALVRVNGQIFAATHDVDVRLACHALIEAMGHKPTTKRVKYVLDAQGKTRPNK